MLKNVIVYIYIYIYAQVLLSDMVEHFNGSKEETVVDLLKKMESEFLIFKKNNLYRLM